MKKPFYFALFFSLFIFVQGSAFAQDQISEKKKELIFEFIKVSRMEEQMDQMMQMVFEGNKIGFKEVVNKQAETLKHLSDQEKAEFDNRMSSLEQIFEKLFVRVKSEIDLSSFIKQSLLPVFDKYYNEEDLILIIEFYRSPTGIKLLDNMSQMGIDVMAVTERDLMPRVLEISNEVIDAEFKKIFPELYEERDN